MIKKREEMWESLGMNWRENSCLPKAKERAAYSFLIGLTKPRQLSAARKASS